jgi:hypothetical protein
MRSVVWVRMESDAFVLTGMAPPLLAPAMARARGAHRVCPGHQSIVLSATPKTRSSSLQRKK